MLLFLFLIIIIVMCVFFVKTFLYLVIVEGNSMVPTLMDGDRVLILRHFPSILLKRSQIIVLDLSKAASIPGPKPTMVIKRLTGLPGDIVWLSASLVDQDILYGTMSTLNYDGYYEMPVPNNHIVVLTDGQGSDSRHWGPIPLQAIVGIVIKRISKSGLRKS